MRSPCAWWKSVPSGRASRSAPRPRCGRCSVSALVLLAQRRAERVENRVAEEDQPPARPQQPVGVRDPDVRVAPDGGAVLREHEVERRVRQRRVLGARVDQRKLDARAPAGARERWRAGSRRGRGPPAVRPASRTTRTSSRCRSRGRPRRARSRPAGCAPPPRAPPRRPTRACRWPSTCAPCSTQFGASLFQSSRLRAACSESSTGARLTEEAPRRPRRRAPAPRGRPSRCARSGSSSSPPSRSFHLATARPRTIANG